MKSMRDVSSFPIHLIHSLPIRPLFAHCNPLVISNFHTARTLLLAYDTIPHIGSLVWQQPADNSHRAYKLMPAGHMQRSLGSVSATFRCLARFRVCQSLSRALYEGECGPLLGLLVGTGRAGQAITRRCWRLMSPAQEPSPRLDLSKERYRVSSAAKLRVLSP